MSDSFLLATRIPMSRTDFERWLDTPAVSALIANPEAMFEGWLWDGSPARWSPDPDEMSPREFFADGIADACAGEPAGYVLLHRDGALEAYLMFFGFREYEVSTALVMFAAAGRFKSEPGADTVLFWSETGANLCDADWDGRLAVLSVDRDGGRFAGRVDLRAAVEGLRPVESRFFELVDRLAEAEEEADDEDEYHTDIPRDPAFVDAAVLTDPS